jgi:hypothetical protein
MGRLGISKGKRLSPQDFFRSRVILFPFEFWVQDFAGAFHTNDGQRRVVQKPELFQDGGLVPIDVLVGEFAVAETNNRDQRHFDAAIGRRNSGQHPGHFLRVSEGEDHFINELIFADGAGDGSKRGVGRHHGYELVRIEVAQGGLAVTACHDGDVVDVSVLGHSGQCGFGVARDEFVRGVFFPEFAEVVS